MASIDDSWNGLYDILKLYISRISTDPLNYLELHGLTEVVSKLVFFEDSLSQNDCLTHYTSLANVVKMFDPSHGDPIVRMYNYELANDPEEGKIKPPEWKELEDKAVNELFGALFENEESLKDQIAVGSAFGCSFSSGPCGGVEDDMTYWRLYGNDGQGCSLRLSSLPTRGAYKVRYRHRDFSSRSEPDQTEDLRVAARLSEFVELAKEAIDCTSEKFRHEAAKVIADALFRVFYGYYHLVKHIAYEDEQEWRVITVMPSRNEIRYDTDSPNLVKRYTIGPKLDELLGTGSTITLGPAVPNSIAARDYFDKRVRLEHGMDSVGIGISDQSYRTKHF